MLSNTTHTTSNSNLADYHHIAGIVGFHIKSPHKPEDVSQLRAMEIALQTSLSTQANIDSFSALSTTGDLAKQENDISLAVIGSPMTDNKSVTANHLLDLYKTLGVELLNELEGEFALVIADGRQGRTILTTDKMARFPIFHANNNGELIFATAANSILACNNKPTPINDQGIYNYLFNHMVPSPGSVYQGLKKLPMAHYLIADSSGTSIQRYWEPNFTLTIKRPQKILQQHLRSTLRDAVKTASRTSKKIGSFLSGGLDSSTVTGMLADITEAEAPAFSIGFSAKGYDEIEYARITAKHFNVKLHEYYVTPDDIVEALPKIATSYDEPFGNSSALPAWFCAKFAKEHGIERLLAGDGGDELFAGNERYARQKLFQHYYNLPVTLKDKFLTPISKQLPDNPSILSKIRSYIEQANTPLPDRLQSYNFLHRHTSEQIFTDEFIHQVRADQPLEFMRDTYGAPKNADDVSRMLYMDWQYTLADNDLRKVTHMCSIAGIDVRYPMLDDQLIKFSCEIPSSIKLKGQALRHFYKRTLRGWLPDATIDKPKQGFGLPFGVWLKDHAPLREMGYDSLNAFKHRKIIKPEFIDELKRLHQEVHPHYYGEFIWVIIVLEHWLKKNQNQ